MNLTQSYQQYGIYDETASGVLRRVRRLMNDSYVSLEQFRFLDAQKQLKQAIDIAAVLHTDIEKQP